MKTKSISIIAVLTALFALSIIGCVKEEKAKRKKVIDTWTFHYFKQRATYLVGNPDRHPSRSLYWKENGRAFTVFFVQDGMITQGGDFYSNETSLTEEQRSSIDLTYDVDVPPSIRRENQYDYNVIALGGYDSYTLTDGNIVIKMDLNRDAGFNLWDVGYTSKNGNKIEQNTNSKSLCTYEDVLVKNKTSKPITVKHKGFEADEKWYWTKATVSITPQLKAIPQGVSQSGEVESENIEIPSHDYAAIWSKYIPTGKHIKDARLVLEIDGKVVKTPPVSSDIDIEYGEYYTMAVKWDGENLDWVYNVDEDF